jgi:MinD superfamily P-loop ATPase
MPQVRRKGTSQSWRSMLQSSLFQVRNKNDQRIKKSMIISIASGKGGTGKTTVSTNLALSLKESQLLDCDVEEPNSHIFIKPYFKERTEVFIPVPEVDGDKCNGCGKCQEVCVYNAIAVVRNKTLIFRELCHGCGACSYLCPENALKEVKKEIGITETGIKNHLLFSHGKLKIGEMMAPPLIRAVKEKAKKDKAVIIDAPPGTACPMISTIKDSDFVILVTEPTPFGLNDLTLAVEVVRKLKIPLGVIINKSDIGNDDVSNYCRKENIPILMQIPFKREIAVAYSEGIPLIEAFPQYKNEFVSLYQKIRKDIGHQDTKTQRKI